MKNKTSNLITLLSITGIMILSAGTSVAGSKVSDADLNYDGMITLEEVVTYVQMNYSKAHVFSAEEAAELAEIFDIDG